MTLNRSALFFDSSAIPNKPGTWTANKRVMVTGTAGVGDDITIMVGIAYKWLQRFTTWFTTEFAKGAQLRVRFSCGA